MTPATAAWRFGCSMLLGGCLGFYSGFLRPLGRKHRTLSDLLFSLGAVWVWIYICFAVCRADIRTVYLFGMAFGVLLWEKTVGVWLQPVFSAIWRVFAAVFRFFLILWKKFLEIAKILFASAEKWVTIERTKVFKFRKKRRKESHGRIKHPTPKGESGSSFRIQYP